ncbi:hypothetical protein FH972_014098 [Carpinus fangiana]|uniref:Glycosyltransferase family 92 protein n=1 Tax=Carpinus fangiana TaxID=176857 RepID=A0A5N6R8P4_9ROSI|nr:hypothetical protein FH972_014098 [Carpinus fangiana]
MLLLNKSLFPLLFRNSFSHHQETMRRRVRTAFVFGFLAIVLFAFVSLHLSRDAISEKETRYSAGNLPARSKNANLVNFAVQEELGNHRDHEAQELGHLRTRRVASIGDWVATVSILLPAWKVLVIVSPETTVSPGSGEEYRCLFQNNATSVGSFSGVLPFTNRIMFKCDMPSSVRRLRPFLQPILIKPSENESPAATPTPQLIRCTFVAYESFSTEDDVVLFVKGVNHRQGLNRSPDEFMCVFGDDTTGAVKTPVLSSVQEVFRCPHPKLTAVSSGGLDEQIKISLEIVAENLVAPSVAYYTPPRSLANPHQQQKSLLCACTMVYNVAKFLKEWVMYHSKIGVQKFILYDNDSDDDLGRVVEELNREGFNVTTVFWIWPKTQEAGFSHSAIYAKDSCTWMMYVDVDEFVFSPSWHGSTQPFNRMLRSLLPRTPLRPLSSGPTAQRRIGQVMIRCNEFGPSNQTSHPIEGVTQGYTCRRKIEQRHKSILLLDAVDSSLLNVVHHFRLKEKFRSKAMSLEDGVVNHYKYQAWSEFRAKFRRRVSAYVVDWTKAVNPMSKDRTPGLGFEPVEPKGWAQKFCEVRDNRLKLLTQKWFESQTPNEYQKMAWQR